MLKKALEFSDGFSPALVFIGGLAVFAHCDESPLMKEFKAGTHDGDFCISLADYADLRDIEVITPNRRLSKSQLIKDGFEFDIYVENQHDLPVPYVDMLPQSEERIGMRVACPEHILVLKQAAFHDRKGSPKGDKDLNDMFKMLVVISERGTTPERMALLNDDLMALLSTEVVDISKNITRGNLHRAAALRQHAQSGLDIMTQARNPAPKL